MGPNQVELPPDLPNWRVVKEALRELRGKLVNKTISQQEVGWYMQFIYNTIQSDQCSPGNVGSQLSLLKAKVQAKVKQKLDQACLWYGVLKFLKKVPGEEREQFMNSTLPSIIEFALRIEEFAKKEMIVWSKQQIGGRVILSRKFVCSVVACFFLCLFPERKRHGKQPVNIINFTNFFKHLPLSAQIAKLRCVLHYFECVIQHNMDIEGNMVFHRKVASSKSMVDFKQLAECRLALCPLTVVADGKMEDSGRNKMQVCFGNRSLGGGVLGKSRVQEEIKFSVCPELLSSMLLMENMEDNEAIEISGFEQFSLYKGYGESFQFDGHCREAFGGMGSNSGRYYMITIDATSYRGKEPVKQYEEENVLRDLNKALIGFCDTPATEPENISPKELDLETGKVQLSETENVVMRRKMSTSKKNVAEADLPSKANWQHFGVETVGSPALPDKERSKGKREGILLQDEAQRFSSKEMEHFLQQPPQRQPPSDAAFAGTLSTHVETSAHFQDPSDLEPYSFLSLSTLPYLEAPGVSCIPTHEALSPAVAAFSSSPPHTSAISSGTTEAHGSSPTWPHLDSPVDPSPAADPHPLFSSHATVENIATDISHLPSADISLQADSAVCMEDYSLLDSEQCQSVQSALSDSAVPPSGNGGSFSGAKYYSDVLGNLTTAAVSGAHFVCATPPSYPLTLFQPAETVELDYNCCHSPKQSSAGKIFPLKSKREKILKRAGHSSLDIEPQRMHSHSRRYQDAEKVGSDISNYSTMVCVGSQSASLHSLDDCSSIATSPSRDSPAVLMDHVSPFDDSVPPAVTESSSRLSTFSTSKIPSAPSPLAANRSNTLDAPVCLEPPHSSSPLSSTSSLNPSPNSSFGLHETGLAKPQSAQEFFIPEELSNPRNGTRDFHSEVRDWISASSSSSVIPAPSSSSNDGSQWGSRSGSLSSHGTNSSHYEMADLLLNNRRRSSQMSDGSRRSSSSKHSSDLGTDLEEISETLAKQGHTVIEEEGSQMALNIDFDELDAPEQMSAISNTQTNDCPRQSTISSKQSAADQIDDLDSFETCSGTDFAEGDKEKTVAIIDSSSKCALQTKGSVSLDEDDTLKELTDGKHMSVISFEETAASDPSDKLVSLQMNDENIMTGASLTTFPQETASTPQRENFEKTTFTSEHLQVDSSNRENLENISCEYLPSTPICHSHFDGQSSNLGKDLHDEANHSVAMVTDELSLGAEPKPHESCISAVREPVSNVFSATLPKDQLPLETNETKTLPERDLYVTTSRYLFSDVASGPFDEAQYQDRIRSPSPLPKDHLTLSSTNKCKGEDVKRVHVSSPLMSLFISNLARIIVNEAIKEGSKVIAQVSRMYPDEEKEVISDEVYTMFATDIVNQVFVHVLSSVESEGSLSLSAPPEAIALLGNENPKFRKPMLEESVDSELSNLVSTVPGNTGFLNTPLSTKLNHDLSSQQTPFFQSQTNTNRSVPVSTPVSPKPSSQKLKNSSASSSKAIGISKTVSFEDTCNEAKSSTESPILGSSLSHDDKNSVNNSFSTVFQRPASTISSSSTSKEAGSLPVIQPASELTKQTSPTLPRLSHSQSALELSRKYSLTMSDWDIHQTAVAIVNQVFQSISDSLGKDNSLTGLGAFSDTASMDSSLSAAVNSYRKGQYETLASNIFSSSPAKPHSSARYSGHSSSLFVVSRKPMSREVLTNAFLKVDSTPSVKTYERRSSEPCHTSVQLSLQAFNDNRFSTKQAEEKQSKLSCTDDDIHQGRTWRRGSLDGFSFERRRNSCGFKDPVLSRFAEELMKADTSVPELVIFGSRHSSSTTGSRRSSISGFKDTTLANLESELLNTSFTSICSLSLSQSPRSQHRQSRTSLRSRSWELRQGKSDSSDTEHLFPLPKYVGDEFLQEYRKQYGHEDDKDISGSTTSLTFPRPLLPFQWDPELQTKEEQAMEMFASSLSEHILQEAFSSHHVEEQAMPSAGRDDIGLGDKNLVHEVVSGNISIVGGAGESSVYFGEGARPKISEPRRTSSKARAIPQRKSDSHRHCDDSASSDGFGFNSVSSEGIAKFGMKHPVRSSSTDLKDHRSFLPLFRRLMSQEGPRTASQEPFPSSSVPELVMSSRPRTTAAQTSLSKIHRRHLLSRSVSVQLSGSSSDVTSSSTTSVPKIVRGEERRRRASSETSYSYGSGTRSSKAERERGHHDPLTMNMPLRYEFGCDDSVDSVRSSCSDLSAHSGQTRSSVLSSSFSDSEGSRPRPEVSRPKASQAERKKRMVTRQTAAAKEASKGSSSLSNQVRVRKERGRKRSLTKPRPIRGSRELCHQFLFPKEDIYAGTLSRNIVTEALKDFTQLKWDLYLSYKRPIVTGNWGCGAFRGNAQLKLVLQWIAASVSKAPNLLYYTFGDSRLSQAKDVVQELSTWSVSQLSSALGDYCKWARCHMSDPDTSASNSTSSWIYGLLHLKIGCGRQPSAQASRDEGPPLSLFDYLLNYHKNKEH